MKGETLNYIRRTQSPNEHTLLGNPAATWLSGQVIGMGIFHTGEDTPTWWNPTDTQWKTGAWTASVPWWVIHALDTYTLDNTRINVKPIHFYALRPTGWQKLNAGQEALNWQDANAADYRVEADGSRSYKFQPSLARMHGSTVRITTSDHDYLAIYIYTTMQLVLDNPAGNDDRNTAQIGGIIGGDWWPGFGMTASAFAPEVVPAIGNSACMKLSKIPTILHFLTVSPPGFQNVGYAQTTRGITWENFLKNLPPPLKQAFSRQQRLPILRRRR